MATVLKCENCREGELRVQVRALKDVISIAHASVSSLELESLLNKVLFSVMGFTGMPVGRIALYDDKTSSMTVHTHLGLSEDYSCSSWNVHSGSRLEQILKRNEIFIVGEKSPDTVQAEEFQLNHDSIRSHMSIPLIADNLILGMICLDDFKPRCFDKTRVLMVSTLASFVAMSIDNAKHLWDAQQMSIRDALTGLYNRRHLDVVLPQEVERSRRHGCTFSLLLIDVDYFKKFNDTFGHLLGDKILKMVGRIFKETFRSMDLAFRYGGEEFLVILPMTQVREAHLVSERIRSRVIAESKKILRGVTDMPVTVSIGISGYSHDLDSSDKIVCSADQLLYKAKQQGRNQSMSGDEVVFMAA